MSPSVNPVHPPPSTTTTTTHTHTHNPIYGVMGRTIFTGNLLYTRQSLAGYHFTTVSKMSLSEGCPSQSVTTPNQGGMQDIIFRIKKAKLTKFGIKNEYCIFFMHFCPRPMTTHAESINSDLQRGLDRRLRHTHNIEHRTEPVSLSVPTDRTSGTRTRATQMVTNTLSKYVWRP